MCIVYVFYVLFCPGLKPGFMVAGLLDAPCVGCLVVLCYFNNIKNEVWIC